MNQRKFLGKYHIPKHLLIHLSHISTDIIIMFLFSLLHIYHQILVKNSIQYFASNLLQMLLIFSNSLSLSIRKKISLLFFYPSLTLIFLRYSLILGNVYTNILIHLSKYPIKNLQLFSILTNFERTASSTLVS